MLFEKYYFEESIVSTNESVKIKLCVPGYGKEDLKIEQDGNILVISSLDGKLKPVKYSIPSNIKEIFAKCEKGILEIELLKAEKDKKVIEIL